MLNFCIHSILYIDSGLLFCNAPHIVIALTTNMVAIIVAICCSKKTYPVYRDTLMSDNYRKINEGKKLRNIPKVKRTKLREITLQGAIEISATLRSINK